MKKNYSYLWVFGMLVLTACHVSKDIQTPVSYVPAHYRDHDNNDTASVASVPWRQLFNDATLRVLIDSALSNNFDMQLAIKNIDIANQSLRQARISLLPAVSLNIGASSTIPSGNSLNGSLTEQYLGTNHIEDFTGNIGLSWEADIWGKVRNRKRAALAAYLQTTEAKKAVQTEIIHLVSQSYYSLLMLDEQLAIAKKNAAFSDSVVYILELQQEAGQVTSLATQQATAQRLAAVQLVPQIEQEIALQENALSVLTGKMPDVVLRGSSLYELILPEFITAGIPAQMVHNRPDVKSLELALAGANASVGLAKAEFYPSVTISATTGINSFKVDNWFNLPSSLFGIVAGGISQPLLQRRQIRTRYNISVAEREQAVIRFKKTVLQAMSEVSGAMVKLEKLEQQYTVAEQRTNILRHATRDAQLLFQNGMATYLEVIVAQSNALQSELALAGIKMGQLNAVTELYRSVGGGWR